MASDAPKETSSASSPLSRTVTLDNVSNSEVVVCLASSNVKRVVALNQRAREAEVPPELANHLNKSPQEVVIY